ncbi:MAG: 3-hydroxybutyryl-CoA dehydrogenase [Syntrophomonadaceae bacterium]|mgnify:CR=1 FL=1|nr:3-hydroxybutyryl-CoA dehydrogenase [Syntrophomonadaceae bacterium]
MDTIAVLGAGIMGAGIAQVAALGNYKVILRDIQMTLVEEGINSIANNLDKLVKEGKITLDEKNIAFNLIEGTTDLSMLSNADLIIEAVVENIAIKKQIFNELDYICPDDTIFATNTSSLSITEIASVCKNPSRVIGIHFFYPVPEMKLVEIVKGLQTSDETLLKTQNFINRIDKDFIIVKKEHPGYVVNRILIPYINEAIYVYAENIANANEIDLAMELGAGMPVGPLKLADKLGLDTIYSILTAFYEEFKDSKYRPHPLLATMIRGGYLGEKSGQGFYKY